MPKWNPRQGDGTAEYTRYTLKIQFDSEKLSLYNLYITRHEEG